MMSRYIAYPANHMCAFRRTRGTEIHHVQTIRALQQTRALALNLAETIKRIPVTHDKAHEMKQIRRMNRLSCRIPCRHLVTKKRQSPMDCCIF
jgi:hypothetical protein